MLYQIEQRPSAFTATPIVGLSPLPHIHPHLELIYIIEGCSVANADNKPFLLESGDLFLSFPNQIHFYHDRAKVNGYMLIFSPDIFKDLKDLFHNQIPTSSVIKKERLTIDVKGRLKKIINKVNADSSFDKIAAKGYLLALLGEIMPLMDFVSATSDQDSVKRLMQYCSENYTNPITLDSISKELHLNKYYISHILKERMNIGFTDFVNNMRTEHACNLLEKGANMTEVAYASGFTSIRTFNRVFAQNMGMTPREYIRSKEPAAP